MAKLPKVADHRKADHAIEPLFIERWSPRAMSGQSISAEELNQLFEAARWAPSCFNDQPWLFLYARRDTPQWQSFFDLMVPANQSWTTHAAVLLLIVSRRFFGHNHKPNRTHEFDAGAAWASLALQGSSMGLVVHGMAGFDVEKARQDLHVPEDYTIEAMAAIGRPGDPDKLPESHRAKEFPSGRKKVSEITREGGF